MHPKKAYKFCPRCGSSLKAKADNLLFCSNCHFKFYINPVPCNGVIIENEKQEILLVRRAVAPKKGFWDLPGGFININEDLEQSVKREIKEELAVEIEVEKILNVYYDHYSYQKISFPTLGIVAIAQIVGGKLSAADDVKTFKYFKEKEIPYQKIAFESIKQALRDYFKSRK